MQEPGDRKNNYHMVRLLAVLAVLCGFMSPIIGHPDLRLGSQKLQDIGIQILFLTGGCLAAESWRRDADTLRFLARRFARIWPPFAVMVLNMCLIAGPLVSDLGVQGYFRSWWKNYLLNLRFYIIFSQPGVFAGNPIGQVTNAVLWTLPVGAFLSLVTPFLMIPVSRIGREQDAFRAFGFLTALLCTGDVLFGWRGDLHLVIYATDWAAAFHVMVLYVVGMLCSFDQMKKVFRLQYAPLALAALLMTPMFRYPQSQQLVWLIALPELVFSFVLAEKPVFHRVGQSYDLSYGIFLYGFFFQQLVSRWNIQAGKNWSYAACLTLSLVMTLPAAFLNSALVENPLRESTGRFLQDRKKRGRGFGILRWIAENPDRIYGEAKLRLCRERFIRGTAAVLILVIAGLVWHVRLSVLLVSSGVILLTAAWRLDYRRSLVSEILWFAAVLSSAILMVVYCQYSLGAAYLVPLFSMGIENFLLCALLVFTLMAVLIFLTGRVRLSLVIGILVCAVLTAADVYVLRFRGNELIPSDLRSIRTAAGVAGHYRFLPPPQGLLEATFFLVSYLFLLFLPHEAPRSAGGGTGRSRFLKGRGTVCVVYGILAVAAVLLMRPFMKNGQPEFFMNEGAVHKGFYYNFSLQLKSSVLRKPEEYDPEKTVLLYEKLTGSRLRTDPESEMTGASVSKKPSIIVIMNESFADLRSLYPNLYDEELVTPFLKALKDETVNGKVLVSTFGGGTSNTEFEFLTGFSEAWLPPHNITYQQYIRPGTYSLLTELKNRGYRCVAMHPEKAQNWNREQVYPALGFDEMYFQDAFPVEGYLRGYRSDESMYAFLTEYYEKNAEEPLFLFGVTVQNHGGYLYEGEDYVQEIQAEDLRIPNKELAQYLDLIHRSDRALENLIAYFSAREEEVVVVFFGDHLPAFSEDVYTSLSAESKAEGLALQILEYEVPFLIWTNFPIEEHEADEISMNYLSSFLLETAGMEIPAWNRCLLELEEKIPALNGFAYFSKETGSYQRVEEAEGEEREYLETYRLLQYNGFLDTKHRNPVLFPAYGSPKSDAAQGNGIG